MWCFGVVVMTTAQLHSAKLELRTCTGLNPARGVSEICDGEDLWQWSQLEITLKLLSLVNHTKKIINHHHLYHIWACTHIFTIQFSSSRTAVFFKKYVLKNFIKFTQKHLRRILIKLQTSMLSIKKDTGVLL